MSTFKCVDKSNEYMSVFPKHLLAPLASAQHRILWWCWTSPVVTRRGCGRSCSGTDPWPPLAGRPACCSSCTSRQTHVAATSFVLPVPASRHQTSQGWCWSLRRWLPVDIEHRVDVPMTVRSSSCHWLVFLPLPSFGLVRWSRGRSKYLSRFARGSRGKKSETQAGRQYLLDKGSYVLIGANFGVKPLVRWKKRSFEDESRTNVVDAILTLILVWGLL